MLLKISKKGGIWPFWPLLYTSLLLMSHLNPFPNQTKTKTESERQNRSKRNREGRSERIGEWKKRERLLFPATHHAPLMSIPSPQPTTHMLPWPVTTPPLRHNHRTTLQPSKNPCHKTHSPQPSCHHCHDQATSTTSPPSREIGRESPDLMREVWVFRERSLSFLRESWWNLVNNNSWPTATIAFKMVAVETTGREKEKVRMREKEECGGPFCG